MFSASPVYDQLVFAKSTLFQRQSNVRTKSSLIYNDSKYFLLMETLGLQRE